MLRLSGHFNGARKKSPVFVTVYKNKNWVGEVQGMWGAAELKKVLK